MDVKVKLFFGFSFESIKDYTRKPVRMRIGELRDIQSGNVKNKNIGNKYNCK